MVPNSPSLIESTAHEGKDHIDTSMSREGFLDPVEWALRDVVAGRPVIVIDDEDRENEGDFILAAEMATAATLGFIIRHSGGVVCAPMEAERADRLALPPMTAVNQDHKQTAFTVSVEAGSGVTTGISAADRARTLQLLADPATRPDDLRRPGHIFPLRAHPGGLAERQGHTEAGVALSRFAGLFPVAVISEVCHDDGSMMRLPALRAFADAHQLTLISIEQLNSSRVESPHPAQAAI